MPAEYRSFITKINRALAAIPAVSSDGQARADGEFLKFLQAADCEAGTSVLRWIGCGQLRAEYGHTIGFVCAGLYSVLAGCYSGKGEVHGIPSGFYGEDKLW